MQTDRMRIELTTEPGAAERPNEDYVSMAAPAAGHGGSLVVLDGVTPRRPTSAAGTPSRGSSLTSAERWPNCPFRGAI